MTDTLDYHKINERTIAVNLARRDFNMFLIDFQKKHTLTTAEYLSILTDEVKSTLSTCVKGEREKK